MEYLTSLNRSYVLNVPSFKMEEKFSLLGNCSIAAVNKKCLAAWYYKLSWLEIQKYKYFVGILEMFSNIKKCAIQQIQLRRIQPQFKYLLNISCEVLKTK